MVRRHLSVDFSVPEAAAAERSSDRPICYLPLSFIRKEPSLVWFDLRDEVDRPLPLITKPENATADAAAFIEFARLLVEEHLARREDRAAIESSFAAAGRAGGGLLPAVEQQLRKLVTSEPEEARSSLLRLYRGREAEIDPEFEMRRILCCSSRFSDLAEQLVTSRFLWVPVDHAPGKRRIIKLAYEIPTPNRLGIWRTIASQFGVRQVYWIEPQHMGNQSSYHLTVVTADDLEILDANLLVEDAPSPAEQQVERTVAHLHISGSGLNVPSFAYVVIRVERQGYLSTAALAALAIGALLAVLARYSGQVLTRDHLDGTIAVMLIVPAIVAAFMARPAYRLADRRLLLGLRTLALAVGAVTVCSAVAALALSHAATRNVWLAAAAFCGAVSVIHAVAMFLPRRKRELSTTR